MIVTPHIERLLFHGAAQLKSVTIGDASIARITVPEGKYLILREVIFNPSVNVPEEAQGDYSQALDAIPFQLTINDARKNAILFHRLYRAKIYPAYNPITQELTPGFGEPIKDECWAEFTNAIALRIIKPPLPTVANVGTVSAETAEPIDPTGFAIGAVMNVGELTLDVGQQYLPCGQQQNKNNGYPLAGVAPIAGYREDFRFNSNAGNQLPTPNNVYKWGSIHWVTLTYIEVDKVKADQITV